MWQTACEFNAQNQNLLHILENKKKTSLKTWAQPPFCFSEVPQLSFTCDVMRWAEQQSSFPVSDPKYIPCIRTAVVWQAHSDCLWKTITDKKWWLISKIQDSATMWIWNQLEITAEKMSVQEDAAALNKLQKWEVRWWSSLFILTTDLLNSFGRLKLINIFKFGCPYFLH